MSSADLVVNSFGSSQPFFRRLNMLGPPLHVLPVNARIRLISCSGSTILCSLSARAPLSAPLIPSALPSRFLIFR